MNFSAFNFHPSIQSKIPFTTPTPIQQKSIPAILDNQDVMGLAQTGTGKTAAYVLPILNKLIEGPRGRVRALIVAPTRELAQQIHETINELGESTGLRSITLYGGVSIGPQIHKLRKGVEIVVACPGRLLDHVSQQTINLKSVEVLVLDEADQMFDMGFLPSIRKILQLVPAKRQSLLFSATMPTAIRQLAHEVLHHPVVIQIGHEAPANTVTQALYPVPQHLKAELLLRILQTTDTESILIFTRTKSRAQRLATQLENAGYRATSLQGNLSQNRRQQALNKFRTGELQILVATDIASRGIDVARISHVINFDMPNTVEAYTHRIGRTGRAMKIGDAFTLVCREDFGTIRAIERVLGTKLEQRILPDFDYKTAAPAHRPVERFQRPSQPRFKRPFSKNKPKSSSQARST